jgi:two-component system sensor histidine kinase ResE
MVLADADLLRAVLTNLLTNAIRHSEAGGEVIIQGGHEEDQQAGPQGFLLTVTDEGTGIPPEVLPHIFEPFYRGDQGRSRGEKVHHGLGLSIAQRATERMGGTLSVTSKLHEGSTFIIRL